jgi:hypothetical protein
MSPKRSGRNKFESKAERQARRAQEERSRAVAPDVPRAALVSRLPGRSAEKPNPAPPRKRQPE